MMRLSSIAAVAIATVVAWSPASMQPAQAAGAFAALDGTWRGSGRVMLANGGSEAISCRAYYNVKDAGAGLGFAIRCASPANKIELRAKLSESNGQLSGTWEERTFNATGQVTGTAGSGQMNLAIAGSVNGSVRISFSGRQQRVSISTGTKGLRGIAINLRR